MKKTISVIMAAAMLASSAVAFSSFADGAEGTGGEEKTYSDYVLNCGDEKPVIDGEIDDGYYQSYRIKHEFNQTYSPEENGEHKLWPSGRYEARDPIEGSDDTKLNYAKTAELVAQYINNDPAEATSYFLWSGNYLYVAIEVKDSSIGMITDEKYEMALAKGIDDAGLWLVDDVMPYFTWPGDGMNSTFRAIVDAGAHCGYVDGDVWVGWNRWSRDEKGAAKTNGHYANEEDGLWAVHITDEGYNVEMAFPVDPSIVNTIFCDYDDNNGNPIGMLKYSLSLCDVPEDFEYGLDQGELANGKKVEGFQSNDFIVLNDFGAWNAPKNIIKFSTEQIKTEDPTIPGDINGDQVVDTKDLVRLMKYLAASGEGVEAVNPDINGDGTVDTIDLVRLMKMIASGSNTETSGADA